MNYVVHRRLKETVLCGPVNLPTGTECGERNGYIFFNEAPICRAESHIAHVYLARNDDGEGLLRGRLIRSITARLEHRDREYQNRWDKVWSDAACRRLRRKEHADFWLWSHDFYTADIETLRYIAKLVGAKEG